MPIEVKIKMVKEIIIIVAVIAVVAIVLITLLGRGKANNVPSLNDTLNQVSLPILSSVSTQGLVGFNENQADASSSIDEIKNNISSGNLVTENAIRKLDETVKDVVQINTLTDGGVQTKETGGVLLAKTDTSSLRVLDAFDPAGEGDFIGISGKPLAKDAIARTEETFSGVLTTEAGGTRTIRGSKALFERLQNNLLSQ